jgi:hypothetical protein
MRILRTAAVAAAALAGGLLLAPAAAQAAPATCHHVHQQSGPNVGLLNGTNINLPIGADLNFVGNALGLLGYATTSGAPSTTVTCN